MKPLKILLVLLLTAKIVAAQDEMHTRIRLLEQQIEALRAEVEKLKQAAAPAPPARAEATPAKTERPPAQPTGIDLGPVRATPYGTVYVNLFGNSGGNNNADVPLFATPTGTGSVSATVRQTRLGLKFTGPKIRNAASSGTLEADFFGGFPAIGIGENFGVVRLRLANVRLDWEKTSLVIGQDWVSFAPVSPVSLAGAAIPQMATSGNLWTRLPQVRLERRFNKSRFLWQGAVLSPASGDFPGGANSPALLQPGLGATAKLPYFQSRFSVNSKNWLGFKKAGSIGLSGQYGRGRVGANRREIESVGVALDWNFPLSTRVTFAGEGFFGRDLAGFQGAVFQGVTSDFAARRGASLVAAGARSVGTRGGWTQIGVTPRILRERLTVYGSFGFDDPRDEDLINSARRDARTRNQSSAFSFIYKVSPQLSWGLEWRRTVTNYLNSGRQANNHLNLNAAYSF